MTLIDSVGLKRHLTPPGPASDIHDAGAVGKFCNLTRPGVTALPWQRMLLRMRVAYYVVVRCRDRITLAVLELLESGELAKLKTKWWLEKGKCDKEGSPKKVLAAM